MVRQDRLPNPSQRVRFLFAMGRIEGGNSKAECRRYFTRDGRLVEWVRFPSFYPRDEEMEKFIDSFPIEGRPSARNSYR